MIDWVWLHNLDGDQIDGSIRTVNFLRCFFTHPDWSTDHLRAGEICSDSYLPNDDWVEIVMADKLISYDTESKKEFAEFQKLSKVMDKEINVKDDDNKKNTVTKMNRNVTKKKHKKKTKMVVFIIHPCYCFFLNTTCSFNRSKNLLKNSLKIS